MGAWPELASAWQAGTVSGTQVELACATVPDRHVDRFAQTVEETVEIISALSAHHTGAVLRHWATTADAFAEREAVEAGIDPAVVVPERELSASRILDGVMSINGFRRRRLRRLRRQSPDRRRTPR